MSARPPLLKLMKSRATDISWILFSQQPQGHEIDDIYVGPVHVVPQHFD
jgi:hypothetical protein